MSDKPTRLAVLPSAKPFSPHVKMLVNGIWHSDLTSDLTGDLTVAQPSDPPFRDWVGGSRFPAAPGRYHLYVSYACPFAHRTILYRYLKGLESVISMSVLHPRWAGANGWQFGDTAMSTGDQAEGKQYLYEIYQTAKPDYTGRVTVPVLWDRQTRTIVNNQSSDIIRMFNSEFDAWGNAAVNFYPVELQSQIEQTNQFVTESICNAVYRVGFAVKQSVYDIEVRKLFTALGQLEQRLSQQPYLLGEHIIESDWLLFCTLCRFDAVYYSALKCSFKRLIDYPALTQYTHRLYQTVSKTVRFDQIKQHYYDDLKLGNPAIVPIDPACDFRTIQQAHSHSRF